MNLLHSTNRYLLEIPESTPMPVYGMGVYGVFYLLQQGFTIEQIKGFAESLRPALAASLDDVSVSADHVLPGAAEALLY